LVEVKGLRRHVVSIFGRLGRARRGYRVLRLDHEAQNAVRQRLGALEADAFLARLEQLSFDIA
jgi:hypothetical protein